MSYAAHIERRDTLTDINSRVRTLTGAPVTIQYGSKSNEALGSLKCSEDELDDMDKNLYHGIFNLYITI